MFKEKFSSYFTNRGVEDISYNNYKLPVYIKAVLPKSKDSKILDLGCGFGQSLNALKNEGYSNITGIDVSTEAIKSCLDRKLPVMIIESIEHYKPTHKFDFIIMSHVLEHIKKDKIIETLNYIKENILSKNGSLFVAVPNAQSSVGCYWAYEDFTHQTMFTGGSLSYVTKSAGFQEITFLDIDCMSERAWYKKLVVKLLQKIYIINLNFWHRMMSAYYHGPSPVIFSWEIKALVKNNI